MKIKPSKYNLLIEILTLLLLCGNTLYLILSWSKLPNQIPGHYNSAGEIDRWGGKGEILLTPIINWIMYTGLSLLTKFPQIWNTGVTVTEENAERIYKILKNLIITMKFITISTFVFISVRQITTAAMPGWFLPLNLGLVFGCIIYYCIKLARNR